MKIYQEDIKVKTTSRITYDNITDKVKEIVKKSEVKNGLVLVQTSHTTCSVLFEEFVHDKDFNGDEFLQVDLNNILDNLVPRELSENTNYRYPGPKHIEFLQKLAKENPDYPADPGTILNGDAHIRGSLFGGNQTFAIKDGEMLTGSVGYIYFVD
ncbi:YjbQ family protein [Lactobacillus sp. LL6]|uniref:YjbQ family protein n=1 Tax=Lactobacillus sp. LL6 TaxID=2596827 RepID=UPI0011848A67|nr:YjbQ family protein [Lactobacillus sp. LL6]TSO25697.1 YjbQ family protein [Lactobacillus sp. LL6]